MIQLKSLAVCLTVCLMGLSASSQILTCSAQFGYAGPKGNAFKDPVTNEKLTSFGLGYEADILYRLESVDERLSVGLIYCGNALFGSQSSSAFDIGIYGLSLYGVKGHFRLLEPDATFSPYGSLSLGLTQFATPDIIVGNETIKGGRDYSLGIRPEIGININGLLLSVAYLTPMKYKVESVTGNFDGTAGTLNYSIGYRYTFDLGSIF